MAKTGRPKFEADLQQVEDLAAQGLTRDQIAVSLGVSRETVFQRLRDNPDFSDAIKRGQVKGIALATNKLYERVKAGELVPTIFYLKARAGWRESQAVELSGDVNVRELNLSPELCQRLAESFLRRQATKR